MLTTFIWVCTLLKADRTCIKLYSILEYLYYNFVVNIRYSGCTCRFSKERLFCQICRAVHFHCESRAEMKYTLESLSVSPVSY